MSLILVTNIITKCIKKANSTHAVQVKMHVAAARVLSCTLFNALSDNICD